MLFNAIWPCAAKIQKSISIVEIHQLYHYLIKSPYHDHYHNILYQIHGRVCIGRELMDDQTFETVSATVDQIATSINTAPDQWVEHLAAARQVTTSLELATVVHEHAGRQWQIWLIAVLQRFAYCDTDSGGVLDIANWCLRQALTLLELSPRDVDLMRCKYLS